MPPTTPKLFFCVWVIVKYQFLNDGCHLWHQLYQLFVNQFSKFWCLSDSKFPEFFILFLLLYFGRIEDDKIAKNKSGANIVGHPIFFSYLCMLMLNWWRVVDELCCDIGFHIYHCTQSQQRIVVMKKFSSFIIMIMPNVM